jgi:hypothetical protein
MKFRSCLLIVIVLMTCIGCRASSSPGPTPLAPTTSTAPSVEEDWADVLTLVSQQSLFTFVEDLTSIQPYSGWRNSGTEGEQEALDYVSRKLGEMEHLGLAFSPRDPGCGRLRPHGKIMGRRERQDIAFAAPRRRRSGGGGLFAGRYAVGLRRLL